MAHLTARRPQNIDGDIYVDGSCIDCDTCRWMAPDIFTRADGQSAVFHQPETEAERLAALQAVLPQSLKDGAFFDSEEGGFTHLLSAL
nr:ferredoxin [Nodosilinea sp. LEGE 07088]